MAQIPSRKCGFCNKAVGDLFCEDCHQILCVKCRQDVHDKVPFLQDHKVTNIQKEGNRVFRPQPVCETHKNQFLYYCNKCECLICAECMTGNHNEHKTEKIKTVADTCRQVVILYMEKIKTKVELVKKKLETIDTEHSAQIKSDCESYVSKVTITSGELHEIIDRFKQIHITTASDFKDIENQDLHNKRAFFKRRHDEIVDRLLKFENLLQETHDSIFLTEWKALQTDFKINDDETDDPLACPRQLALFNQSSFTKSVIEEIDEKFQMRLKENENSINELQIENSKLKAEINFKKDENEKLARELDIKAAHNEKLIKQFEDKITDLENKLNQAEKVNTSTSKALKGYKSDFQIPRQHNSLQVEDDKKECSEEVYRQDKGFKTAPENLELKFEITVQQYEQLMFFCKDDIVRSAKHNGKELILKVISQSDGKRYKDLVITEIKTIDQLSQVEIQLDDLSKKKEIEKVIADEFSDIYCKVYEKVVQLFGATYDNLQQAKHRLEIVLGTKNEAKRRRVRRFADPSENYITPSRDDAKVPKKPTNFPSERFSKSYTPSGGVSRSMEQSYTTPEGMTIKVYVGNILKLDVECIVNAANETLSHGGGVAAVISEAAGYQFDQESADYVRLHGTIPVGTCCSTSAGKLHYKYVIHTVGPRWYDYKQNEKKFCAMDLKQSIVCCFEEAEKLQLKSIALPTISAGIFGVPKEICTLEYKNAVAGFSRNSKGGVYLKEIHFIDKDLGLISLIQQEFNIVFKHHSTSSSSASPSRQSKLSRSLVTGDVSGECCICMNKLDNPKTLACGHLFCTECIEQQFKYKPSCPQCGQIHGVVTGTQPDGRMNIRTKTYSLPGYSGTNTIEIEYMIYSGKQGQEHPNPGRLFEGITRTAFLPETKKGKMVLKLLDIAFKRKLVFTIGTSTTSGKTGVVTWNDIHHKTNPKPNTQFGYPDDTYLDRVLEELAAKGITEKDLED